MSCCMCDLGGRYMTAQPEPVSEEVAALLAEQGLDLEASGLTYLSNEARVRLTAASECRFSMSGPKQNAIRMHTCRIEDCQPAGA